MDLAKAMTMTSKVKILRTVGWGAAAVMLLLPLVAMQFTREVNWTASDFMFAGALIGGLGVGLELTFTKSPSWAYRGGAVLALLATFLMTWVNGAVGIIGEEFGHVNILYLGVIPLGLVAAVLAGFRASGMVLAMSVSAAAAMAIPAFALVTARAMPSSQAILQAFILTGFFAGMSLGSALLFRSAARQGDAFAA